MTKIRLNLLDNGIDYIYEAVASILKKHDKSEHSLKYSVLHLYSGIELLLKEKLRQEHWSLIFQDISSANSKKLESGDFVSVYHDELIKRLQNISKVSLNDEPIKKIRDLRNRLEHFEVNISLSECQHIVAAALDEIIKFWETYFKDVSTVHQQKKFQIIKSIATEFEAYKQQRLNKFQSAISGIVESKKGVIVLCPDCSSLSFAVFKDDEKECKCFVCDEKYRKDQYLKNIRNLEENESPLLSSSGWMLYNTICPSCQKNTRIKYQISDEMDLYCCLNCLNEEKIDLTAVYKELVKAFQYKLTTKEIHQLAIDIQKSRKKLMSKNIYK